MQEKHLYLIIGFLSAAVLFLACGYAGEKAHSADLEKLVRVIAVDVHQLREEFCSTVYGPRFGFRYEWRKKNGL